MWCASEAESWLSSHRWDGNSGLLSREGIDTSISTWCVKILYAPFNIRAPHIAVLWRHDHATYEYAERVGNGLHSLILASKKIHNFSFIVEKVHSPLLNGLVVLIEHLANNFGGWIHKQEKFLLQDVKMWREWIKSSLAIQFAANSSIIPSGSFKRVSSGFKSESDWEEFLVSSAPSEALGRSSSGSVSVPSWSGTGSTRSEFGNFCHFFFFFY